MRTLLSVLVGTGLALPVAAEQSFNRLSSFPVAANLPADADADADADPLTETSAEIVTVDASGRTLVYSDSPRGGIGFIDITDPSAPAPGGFLALDGEPTSVAIDDEHIYVALNTSSSYTDPSGALVAVALGSREEVRRCDLGGQPDAIAHAPEDVPGGPFLAIAIENERDEDLGDGAPPQMPAGFVTIAPLAGASVAESGDVGSTSASASSGDGPGNGPLDCGALLAVDLTGLAERFPEDPEPEFVDINAAGKIVVSLQENNHLVVLDAGGNVLNHFSAGAVDLKDIDVDEDGALRFEGAQRGRLREPDAVHWLDETRFVTADEGDLDGGSRGFTVFSREGEVLQAGGTTFEHAAARAGHYPEHRSGDKGMEPEGLEVASFGDVRHVFVLALAVAAETDLGADGGARSQVTLYALENAPPAYPAIASVDDGEGRPIGWGALSGLAADPDVAGLLYAVNDSAYRSAPHIYTIDATGQSGGPAAIVAATAVTRDGMPAQLRDLLPLLAGNGVYVQDKVEGFAIGAAGTAWLVTDNDGVDDANGETLFLELDSPTSP